jgi:hypothetical protein
MERHCFKCWKAPGVCKCEEPLWNEVRACKTCDVVRPKTEKGTRILWMDDCKECRDVRTSQG